MNKTQFENFVAGVNIFVKKYPSAQVIIRRNVVELKVEDSICPQIRDAMLKTPGWYVPLSADNLAIFVKQ